MSQEQLGELVGMGRTAIVAVEAGGRRIRLGEACNLADALGVPLGDMIADKPLTITVAVD